MSDIFKRPLNVITVLATLSLIVLCWMMISSSVENWFIFVEKNLIPLFLVYIAVLIINYMAFGRLCIWHRKIAAKSEM
jgi:hypothetical protein